MKPIHRREFIKRSLAAGAALGLTGLGACTGITRLELSDRPLAPQAESLIDPVARQILHYASLAPSGHNSQPWRVFVEHHDHWVIEVDPDRRLPVVDPHNRELLISMGAFVENLTIAAGALGRCTHVQRLARKSGDREVFSIAFAENRAKEYPLQRMVQRRTVKNGLQPKEIKSEDIRTLARQFRKGRLHYFPRGGKHAECLQEAAVESYRAQAMRDDAQQELVRWLRLSNGDARKHRDGLTTAGMEIDGSTGWFVGNFGKPDYFLTQKYRQKGIDQVARQASEGAGWIVLTSRRNRVADWIDIGRRFQRMALLAREMGLAIHPMTQVLEENTGRELIKTSHAKRLYPQMVLRVGYLDRYPDPVSLRRPVAWFVYS